MTEWKTIPSLPQYQAGSNGKIKFVPVVGTMPHGGTRIYGGGEERIGCWDGTHYILTYKGKTYKIARLICEAFHGPAPFPRAVVMHLNENARDNRPDNLQWGTQKENLAAPGFRAYCRSRTGKNSPWQKHVSKLIEGSPPRDNHSIIQDPT